MDAGGYPIVNKKREKEDSLQDMSEEEILRPNSHVLLAASKNAFCRERAVRIQAWENPARKGRTKDTERETYLQRNGQLLCFTEPALHRLHQVVSLAD